MAAIEARGWFYILGARPRATKEVREEVLTDGGAMTGITAVATQWHFISRQFWRQISVSPTL